ncbi:MAG: hypothetical protein RJB38_1078 [Pseudomonadota bacterium]
MFRRILLAATTIAMGFQTTAQASPDFVKKEVREVTAQFSDSRLGDKFFEALEQLLASATHQLSEEGQGALAAEITTEWAQQSALYFGQFGTLDLGDHEPLNRWLARTYDKIEAKLGKRICHWLRYDDLKIFNFGIPVVFHPRGRLGDSWDEAEYGRHFVPFSGAVTYWTVKGVCQALAPGLWTFGCGLIADLPRYAVERWIAPSVSSRVYRSARGELLEAPLELEANLDAWLGEAERALRSDREVIEASHAFQQ